MSLRMNPCIVKVPWMSTLHCVILSGMHKTYHSTTQYVLLGIVPFTPVPLPSGPSLDSPLRKFWTCGSPEVQMGNESESIARWLFSAKEKSLIPLGRFTY